MTARTYVASALPWRWRITDASQIQRACCRCGCCITDASQIVNTADQRRITDASRMHHRLSRTLDLDAALATASRVWQPAVSQTKRPTDFNENQRQETIHGREDSYQILDLLCCYTCRTPSTHHPLRPHRQAYGHCQCIPLK